MKNPLWFKAKNYGWGWYPDSWQGWVILLIYLGYILYQGKITQGRFDSTSSFVFRYSFEVLFATILLLIVCFLTGEKPEWRWGKRIFKDKSAHKKDI